MRKSPFPILLVSIILLSLIVRVRGTLLSSPDVGRISDAAKAEQVRHPFNCSQSQSIIEPSQAWEDSIISDHFIVSYNRTGSPNGVSDEYAGNVSSSLEYSWTTEIDTFGFSPPPLVDSHIEVFIINLIGSYGVTTGTYYEPPGAYRVDNITIATSMEGQADLLRYVCAHEFFHCIQLSYDNAAYWFIQNMEQWVIEGTAVWMGSMVYPEYTGTVSYVDYANQYLQSPDRRISQLDYDAVLFWIFIYEHFGGFSTIENIIQQDVNLNAIQAVNATMNSLGSTFDEVFKEWTIANYLKDSYYSKGHLFNPIYFEQLPTYIGGEITDSSDVVDWGADYYRTNSSVIHMPISFEGEQTHNLTKILIEHDFPLISDFPLNSSYAGFFNLTQANNLDNVVLIIRSLGDETSNNRVDYSLTFPSSSCTLEGPYYLTSSTTTTTITQNTGTDISSTLTFAVPKESSSHNSSISTITLVNCSSAQISSSKTSAVVNRSSSQNSSEMHLDVRLPPPDIAVTNVATSKTVVGQGYHMNITATVENQGDFTETFNTTAYANTTEIEKEEITLTSGSSTIVTLAWNTRGVVKGNYTIFSNATILSEETDTLDNTYIDGTVLVTIPGDANGDRKVRIDDLLAIASAFGLDLGDPDYDPNLDINGDCKIRVDDVLIAAQRFGEGPW